MGSSSSRPKAPAHVDHLSGTAGDTSGRRGLQAQSGAWFIVPRACSFGSTPHAPPQNRTARAQAAAGMGHLPTWPAVALLVVVVVVVLVRDFILGDGALLYVAYVMLIWAPLIPATRWSCSLTPWWGGGGNLGTKWLPTAKSPHGAEAVNAKI